MNMDALTVLKCEFAKKLLDAKIVEDYGVKDCNTGIFSSLEKVDDIKLKIILLQNIKYLNKKDEFGRDVINCDLTKIKDL